MGHDAPCAARRGPPGCSGPRTQPAGAPGLVCVCVCVFVRARVRACVSVYVRIALLCVLRDCAIAHARTYLHTLTHTNRAIILLTGEDAVIGDDDMGGAAGRLDVAMVVRLHAARPARRASW
jgi:hypothetical protein